MSKKNFSISQVATAPSPATTGTSLIVTAGHGSRFAVNEPAIIFPDGEQPTSSNAEIVMVTGISTDTLTITRTQESTSARTIVVGDIIMQGITANDWNTVAFGANTFKIDYSADSSLSGSINGSNTTFTVGEGSYVSGSLLVVLNGVVQTKGASDDWVETTPASGTFDFNTAPSTGDKIVVYYLHTESTTGNADTLDGLHGSSYATIAGTETLTNKTLTDPQIDNNIMARAYKSGGNQLNLTNSSPTQVTFESEDYDLSSNFASNAFTAPQSGYYRVKALTTFTGVVANKLYVNQIYVNDSAVSDTYLHSGLAQSLSVFAEWTGYITSGQTIKVYATSYSGDNTVDIIQGTKYTWIEVELVGV